MIASGLQTIIKRHMIADLAQICYHSVMDMDNDALLQEIARLRACLLEAQATITEMLTRLSELEAEIIQASGEHAYGDPGAIYPVREEG